MRGCQLPSAGRITAPGVELAAVDAQRAAEAAADIERRLDDGVAGEARGHRFEIGDFPRRAAAGHSVPPRYVRVRGARFPYSMPTERSCVHGYCLAKRGKWRRRP